MSKAIEVVVKVQVAMFVNTEGDQYPHIIVYDEKKNFMYEGIAPKGLMAKMKGRKKAYFWALADTENCHFDVYEDRPVRWQNW